MNNTTNEEDELNDSISEVSDVLGDLEHARDVLSGCESVEKISDLKSDVKETIKLLRLICEDLSKIAK